jgi:ABC-type branched-subunit amino acid transport system substrate-binding protein
VRAQSKPTLSVGVLTDLSGTYRDNTGPTSVACVQHAIDEFNAPGRGSEIAFRNGNARYPFPETSDFSGFPASAASSGAQVLRLANAGADTVNCVKQANEFGLNHRMTIAPLIMLLHDAHLIGRDTRQGLIMSETFYRNMNDRTRAWTKRALPPHARQLAEPGPCERLWVTRTI